MVDRNSDVRINRDGEQTLNPNNVAGGWRADAEEKKRKEETKQQENMRRGEAMQTRRQRENHGAEIISTSQVPSMNHEASETQPISESAQNGDSMSSTPEAINHQQDDQESSEWQPISAERAERLTHQSGETFYVGANGKPYQNEAAAQQSIAEAQRQSPGTVQVLVEDILSRSTNEQAIHWIDSEQIQHNTEEGNFFSSLPEAVRSQLGTQLSGNLDNLKQSPAFQTIVDFLDRYGKLATGDENLRRKIGVALQYLDPQHEVRQEIQERQKNQEQETALMEQMKQQARAVVDDFAKLLAFSYQRAEDIDKYARQQYQLYGEMTEQVRNLLQTLLRFDNGQDARLRGLNNYMNDIDHIRVQLRDLDEKVEQAKSSEQIDRAVTAFNDRIMRPLSERFDQDERSILSNPQYGENSRKQFAGFRKIVDDYRVLASMSKKE